MKAGDRVLYEPDECHKADQDALGNVVGNRPWEATVEAVHKDGTATLRVRHPSPGITYEYKRREGGPGKPGTFYTPDEEG